MQTPMDLEAVRTHGVLAARAGYAFLLVFGVAWLAAGALSYAVPQPVAPWLYLFLGIPATPLAIFLDRRSGSVPRIDPDPLFELSLQIVFVQIVAFPAVLLVGDLEPAYLPVAFASVVGAHFLPFSWVYRTRLYVVLGVTVSAGAYLCVILFGRQAMHLTGFYVGAVLLAGAVIARGHAERIRARERIPRSVSL